MWPINKWAEFPEQKYPKKKSIHIEKEERVAEQVDEVDGDPIKIENNSYKIESAEGESENLENQYILRRRRESLSKLMKLMGIQQRRKTIPMHQRSFFVLVIRRVSW